MALRLDSLKTRMTLTTTLVIVVILVANAVYLVVTKRGELRRDVDDRAMTFAQLTNQPICEGYETFYASGFYKFRELMRAYLKLEPDVEKILIVNVNGEVLFDSANLEGPDPRPERVGPRRITEPDRLQAVKSLPPPTRLPARDASGASALEIVAPYQEDWGRHRLSVLYGISYRSLEPRIARVIFETGVLTLLSILVSVLAIATVQGSMLARADLEGQDPGGNVG